MIYTKDTIIHPYGQHFSIIISDNYEEISKSCGFEYREEDLGYACAFHKDTEIDNRIYVVLNPWLLADVPTISAGTIAHETTHVKNYLFLKKGITNCLKNDEPEAYLVGWITDTITDFLDEVITEYTNGNKEEA